MSEGGYVGLSGEVEPGIYEQALPPDGARKVRCWTRQRLDIVADVEATGSVILVKSTIRDDVFDRVDPESQEGRRLLADPNSVRMG